MFVLYVTHACLYCRLLMNLQNRTDELSKCGSNYECIHLIYKSIWPITLQERVLQNVGYIVDQTVQ